MSLRPGRPLRAGRRHLPRSLPITDRRYEAEERPALLRKSEAPCCVARALPDGRPVIGWCSPGCLRRLERQTWTEGETPPKKERH